LLDEGHEGQRQAELASGLENQPQVFSR